MNQVPEESGRPRRSLHQRILSDSLSTYGTELLSALLLFANGVVVARVLGPEGRGIYAVLVLVPMSLFQLSHLGLFQGLVHGTVKDREGLGARTVNIILVSLLLGGVLTVVAAWIYSTDLLPELGKLSRRAILLALVGLPALFLNTYSRALVLGQDDLKRRNLLRLIEPSTYFVAIVPCAVIWRWGVDGAILAWALSLWAVSALGLYFLLPAAIRNGFRGDRRRLERDVRFGIQAWGGAVAMFLLYRQDQFLVAYFLDSAAVGYYAVARSLMMMMGILPNAVQAALLPKITAEFHETGGRDNTTAFVCRMMFLVSMLFSVVAAIGAYPAVALFYGREFQPAAGAFLVFLPVVTFLAGLSALNAAMQARGAHKWVSIGAAIALVANFILDILLIPWLGILGAALASSLSYLVLISVVTRAFLRLEPHLGLRDLLVPRREEIERLATAFRQRLRRSGR